PALGRGPVAAGGLVGDGVVRERDGQRGCRRGGRRGRRRRGRCRRRPAASAGCAHQDRCDRREAPDRHYPPSRFAGAPALRSDAASVLCGVTKKIRKVSHEAADELLTFVVPPPPPSAPTYQGESLARNVTASPS